MSQFRRFNRYQDTEIDASFLPHENLNQFFHALAREEQAWLRRLESRVGDTRARMQALFWVKIPVEIVYLLQALLGSGAFTIHHATARYIMIVKGPGTHISESVPLYGTHYVRVECLVLDGTTGQVLVVRERIGHMECKRKLVTGSVDLNEYVSHAAEREVFEETGIRATFSGIIGIVNRVCTRFGRDEILVGCLLRTSAPDQQPVANSTEIRTAEWTMASSLISENNMAAHWIKAVANLALVAEPKLQGCLPEQTLEDFRGHGHEMRIYAL